MNLASIQKILELKTSEDVNLYLACGWSLLEIFKTDYGNPYSPGQTPLYIVGWNDRSHAPIYPDRYACDENDSL